MTMRPTYPSLCIPSNIGTMLCKRHYDQWNECKDCTTYSVCEPHQTEHRACVEAHMPSQAA